MSRISQQSSIFSSSSLIRMVQASRTQSFLKMLILCISPFFEWEFGTCIYVKEGPWIDSKAPLFLNDFQCAVRVLLYPASAGLCHLSAGAFTPVYDVAAMPAAHRTLSIGDTPDLADTCSVAAVNFPAFHSFGFFI